MLESIACEQLPLAAGHISEDERLSLLEFHPVRERNYTIPTWVMENTYAIVKERVWARRTGVFFYAAPRMGKSTCVSYIKERLANEFKRIYVLLVDARGSSRPSYEHMFRLILEAKAHDLAGRKNADFLFRNVVTDIAVKVGIRGGSHFVLLIDELQLLNETDLQQLLVLHNALERLKIKMTTVSFAQPEIMHRHSLLQTAKQRQIIARFLSEPIKYVGCGSEHELARILQAYDENTEFPLNSGLTYTQFFLPNAYKNGFRLKRYSSQIWSVLSKAARALGDGMVPMEHLTITIEHCLLASWNDDVVNFVLSNEDIEAAVQAANLESFSSLMHD